MCRAAHGTASVSERMTSPHGHCTSQLALGAATFQKALALLESGEELVELKR